MHVAMKDVLRICILLIAITVKAKQMCYSCQYNNNAKKDGYECVTDPRNWTIGNWRMKCPNKCIIMSTWDKESKDATFLYRGCSGKGEKREDKCTQDNIRMDCFYSCEETYCNDFLGREAFEDEDDFLGDAVRNTSLNIFTVLLWTLGSVMLLGLR